MATARMWVVERARCTRRSIQPAFHSAERSERHAELADEELRLLPRREVTALSTRL
jgi:hypothetical protein